MKLKIESNEGASFVYDERDNIIAKFYGPLAKTFAETFVRAIEAGNPVS